MATRIVSRPVGAASPKGTIPEAHSNVLTLPVRTRRRGRKAKPSSTACRVLKFTGTKRFVYDRDEMLQYKSAMRDALFRFLRRVADDEITGLLIIGTHGSERDGATAHTTGLFMKQPELLGRYGKLAAESIGREDWAPMSGEGGDDAEVQS